MYIVVNTLMFIPYLPYNNGKVPCITRIPLLTTISVFFVLHFAFIRSSRHVFGPKGLEFAFLSYVNSI